MIPEEGNCVVFTWVVQAWIAEQNVQVVVVVVVVGLRCRITATGATNSFRRSSRLEKHDSFIPVARTSSIAFAFTTTTHSSAYSNDATLTIVNVLVDFANFDAQISQPIAATATAVSCRWRRCDTAVAIQFTIKVWQITAKLLSSSSAPTVDDCRRHWFPSVLIIVKLNFRIGIGIKLNWINLRHIVVDDGLM